MEKINIAELLKNCPKGMELDCTIWDNVVLAHVDINSKYPIWIKKMEGEIEFLTENGCFNFDCSAKCVIFPKDKTTWEGFVPPCKFKDGDVVISNLGDIHLLRTEDSSYCAYRMCWSRPSKLDTTLTTDVKVVRLATEEEKAKLFDSIRANGYKWNEETKTLEKLVRPTFKVGDKIRKKGDYISGTVTEIDVETFYKVVYDGGAVSYVTIKFQDEWELVKDKFDVINFEPFMKVLVRSDNSDIWECDFFSSYNPKCSNRFHCVGAWYNICIPYIGNEHLRGTTNDCDDFYKNWEE